MISFGDELANFFFLHELQRLTKFLALRLGKPRFKKLFSHLIWEVDYDDDDDVEED